MTILGHLAPNHGALSEIFTDEEFPTDEQLLRNIYALQTALGLLANLPGYGLVLRALLDDLHGLVSIARNRGLEKKDFILVGAKTILESIEAYGMVVEDDNSVNKQLVVYTGVNTDGGRAGEETDEPLGYGPECFPGSDY